jgi:hypothetical protein
MNLKDIEENDLNKIVVCGCEKKKTFKQKLIDEEVICEVNICETQNVYINDNETLDYETDDVDYLGDTKFYCKICGSKLCYFTKEKKKRFIVDKEDVPDEVEAYTDEEAVRIARDEVGVMIK